MRWLIFFAVLVGGCAASMPDDPMLTGDLAWGVAKVVATSPKIQEPSPGPRCSECTGSGVVTVANDEPTSCKNGSVPPDSVLIVVEVPEGVPVVINGHPTTSTGRSRQFMARGLVSGKQYDFVVNANGQSRVVTMTAGEQANVSFIAAVQTCPSCGGCGLPTRSVMVSQ